jgi:hypothetical protein
MDLDEDSAADAFFRDLLDAVDQQLASGATPFVGKTLDRLVKAGMEIDAAKEAIAACLAEESDRMFRSGKPFDLDSYRKSLERISPPS